jgi:hypothetical protein
LCGEQRIGAFRYCRSCQFDFEPDHARIAPRPFTLADRGAEQVGQPVGPGRSRRTSPASAVPAERLTVIVAPGTDGMAIPDPGDEPRSLRSIVVPVAAGLAIGALCAIIATILQ